MQVTDKFIYIGPSWAAQNYESPTSGIAEGTTNLAKEWNIPHCNLSKPGQGIDVSLELIRQHPADLPIVWIYGEPSMSIPRLFGISYLEFIQRADWRELWEQCNQYCLQAIDQLNRKILLFGAHSDIVNCNFKNITVGHHSYQKFLANQIGSLDENNNVVYNNPCTHDYLLKFKKSQECVIVTNCWGPDIVHKEIYMNQNIKPDMSIVEATTDMLNFWAVLEEHGLFYETHPTKKGIELFAKETRNTVLNFLESVK